jgi:hypothetical protein
MSSLPIRCSSKHQLVLAVSKQTTPNRATRKTQESCPTVESRDFCYKRSPIKSSTRVVHLLPDQKRRNPYSVAEIR